MKVQSNLRSAFIAYNLSVTDAQHEAGVHELLHQVFIAAAAFVTQRLSMAALLNAACKSSLNLPVDLP